MHWLHIYKDIFNNKIYLLEATYKNVVTHICESIKKKIKLTNTIEYQNNKKKKKIYVSMNESACFYVFSK